MFEKYPFNSTESIGLLIVITEKYWENMPAGFGSSFNVERTQQIEYWADKNNAEIGYGTLRLLKYLKMTDAGNDERENSLYQTEFSEPLILPLNNSIKAIEATAKPNWTYRTKETAQANEKTHNEIIKENNKKYWDEQNKNTPIWQTLTNLLKGS
jgi:hypothetical protein